MMRVPTSRETLYAWHSKALRGLAPVNDGTPQAGFFKRKLVKGGVMVPARIWMHQDIDADTGELLSDEQLQCEVNGSPADPEEAWSWICQDPITEQEFRYLTARIAFASQNEPADPFFDARKPINFNQLPALF